MAEEKEATALSRAFSRLEGIFAVECWAEAFLNKVQVQIACFEEFSKKVHAVVRDTEVCVNKLASTDHRIRYPKLKLLLNVLLLFSWLPSIKVNYLDLLHMQSYVAVSVPGRVHHDLRFLIVLNFFRGKLHH